MRVLSAIVGPQALPVDAAETKVSTRTAIGSQLVGHDQRGPYPVPLQEFLHQLRGDLGVSSSLDHKVQDLTLVVDCTPEPMLGGGAGRRHRGRLVERGFARPPNRTSSLRPLANLRINAQLIDTANSGHLWAERFDGAWGEVFSLQDQVVEKVAAALQLRLVSGPRMAEAPGATTVPAAYDLYLQAYGLDYGKFPAEVASLLRQAVALDPNFGQAWAELGWLYWNSMGIEEAERALGIPRSQMPGKIKEFLSEAEKHPSSNYYNLMADLLLWQRKSDEAIASAGRAIALDPSDPLGILTNEPGVGPQRARGGCEGLSRCRSARRSAAQSIPPFPGRPHRILHGGVRRRRCIPRKGHL